MVRKEVKELLTPASLVPIIIMALLFGFIGNAFSGVTNPNAEKPTIGVVNLDGGALSGIAYQTLADNANVVYNGTDVDIGITQVQAQGGLALLVIASNFTSSIEGNRSGVITNYWFMKGTGFASTLSLGTVQTLIAQVNMNVSKALIGTHAPVNATVILNPTALSDTTIFRDRTFVGISPSTISSVLGQQGTIVPLIIMIVIIMAGSMVITSMGNEKENKTLETLLTLPVSRTSIVAGKLIGAAVVGLVMAVIYMTGLGYYSSSISGGATGDLAKFGLSISALDYLIVGVSLFLALVCALALCMVLGIFAKNYKAAQSLTMPITFLALIPYFILIFADFETLPPAMQGIVFAIPFSHPMMAMNELMFGNVTFVFAGIAYEAAFALVTMFIAVTLFKKDILLTGRVKNRTPGAPKTLVGRAAQALFGGRRR
jgi:ABC-2 type transport system permease protein